MSLFDGICLRHVAVLLGLLQTSTLTRKAIIEKRYQDHALAFEATLNFLVAIGAVRDSDGYLRPSNLTSVDSTNETQVGAHVLDMLMGGNSTYRGEALGYLKSFEMKEGEIQYCPPPEARGKHSAVRNLLMELRVVTYDRARDIYRLAPEYFSLYVANVASKPALSLRFFRQMVRDKEDIGLAAEFAVLAYEKERVGKHYSECVEHTALKNVNAGYDITSVTSDECSLLPRLIEVKAVSAQDFQFFWSANEVTIASMFAPWYYLYLLPVKRHGEFSMDRLRIIPNPCAVVLAPGGEWLTEENAIRCAIKEQGTQSQRGERYDVG